MNNKIRFTYLRDHNEHPIACVAVMFEPNTKQLIYGISTLNPSDTFNKKVARDLAVGRLVQKPSRLTLHIPKHEITAHEITRRVLKDLLMWGHEELPNRTRKGAQKWLQESLIRLAEQNQIPSDNDVDLIFRG